MDSKENDDGFRKKDDIRVLKLYPHAMQQANAYYSPDAHGIPCSVFFADNTGQGRNLPGQRVSPVSRKTSSRMSAPRVLAFHEGLVDLCALFAHFSHKEALTDAPAGVSIRPTWRRLPDRSRAI